MAQESADLNPDPASNERRGNPRRSHTAVFSMRFTEGSILGAGRDVATGGAYFVSSDDVKVEVTFEIDGCERKVPGRVVRMDQLSASSLGIALQFDEPQDL